MDGLLELLKNVRDDIDFETATDLIDKKILSSLDIVQIIAEIDEEYDITVPAKEIIPDNFNSLMAIFNMIQRLNK